jgi:hypothetical protein
MNVKKNKTKKKEKKKRERKKVCSPTAIPNLGRS